MIPQKKSLLVDAHIFDKEPQGTATYIKGIYNAFFKLYSNLYEVYICANDINNMQNVFPDIPRQNFLFLKKCSSVERLMFALPKMIVDNNIQFAHFQQIAPLRKACKYITTVHDVLFNDFKDKFSYTYRVSRNYLFKKSLRMSDIRLTVSEYSKKAIEESYNINNIHVTHNAVRQSFFKQYNKQSSVEFVFNKFGVKKYILYVSRIEARKNHTMLLKAYRELKLYSQGISLVFVGKNDIPVKELSDEIRSLNEEEKEHFFWLQNVHDEDLLEIFKGALMFVYPSMAEGFGIPPIEAAALKINTLCSNTTAMHDFYFLRNNQFNPYNYHELKEKLLSNIVSPPSASTLDQISHTVSKEYSWNKGAETIHQLLLDLHKTVN